MFYEQQGDTYIMRFEEGEVFPDRLLQFVADQGISAGSFTGIGALKQFEIAYFDIAQKEYLDRRFDEQVEVLALVGNVAMHEGDAVVHAHITVGRRDYAVLGGHLRSGVVRPTLEVTLQRYFEPMQRKIDPAFGLPGLDLRKRF
ncbi:MAG TPA: PPC domain-containing DNA-binding protein [Gemmatimonadota bacterium]|nr:PPC domain-containing DNA-binding protein [Gemmatimonadota bacterium]